MEVILDKFFEEYLKGKGENLRRKLENEKYKLISKRSIDKPLLLTNFYVYMITLFFILLIVILVNYPYYPDKKMVFPILFLIFNYYFYNLFD